MHLTDVLKLDQEIFCLDCETTGIHPKVDRIVQIGLMRIAPDGTETRWESLVNPTVPIPPEATAVHKITNEAVKTAHTFAQLAPVLFPKVNGRDLIGTNVRFDVDFFFEEFKRVGYVYGPGRIVDSFKNYNRLEPRNLAATFDKFVRNNPDPGLRELYQDLIEANDYHTSALFDARCSAAAVHGQLLAYPEFPRTPAAIHAAFTEVPTGSDRIDPEGKFAWRDGVPIVNFGKRYAGTPMRSAPSSFYQWILDNQFEPETKAIARNALAGQWPTK